jgi:hypothetical protein
MWCADKILRGSRLCAVAFFYGRAGVLRLTGPQGIELDVQLDKGVLAGSERASFQRKTRQFIVTFDVK